MTPGRWSSDAVGPISAQQDVGGHGCEVRVAIESVAVGEDQLCRLDLPMDEIRTCRIEPIEG
jgi:hypothetical protein